MTFHQLFAKKRPRDEPRPIDGLCLGGSGVRRDGHDPFLLRINLLIEVAPRFELFGRKLLQIDLQRLVRSRLVGSGVSFLTVLTVLTVLADDQALVTIQEEIIREKERFEVVREGGGYRPSLSSAKLSGSKRSTTAS